MASMPVSPSEETQRKSDFPLLLSLISEDLIGLPGVVSQTSFLEGTDLLLSLGWLEGSIHGYCGAGGTKRIPGFHPNV